ncbi:D-alanyl-D-alanine carboxypeptidase / D-alanyl-D-alanine-endopeptidase (penicillin-binding protein 4) [Granulicella rosea]|uniref:D-alanyl-D-alanine carboxypeptidase / D-alanyl-D-alanine-endopeptidase (Penicillin-binding protein 4) n=1 Tax=Granulicella rosea TaxID=474952 RepID=A0A239LUD8_9BACT|nr:D-alanyl-D-alanine carboxypeptidase/D-alanyl-D-alanine-endopeptidase [Granulicella rosea]SNT33309.1 D-alanyl-D-alanine carboxypeptidase / D-alanyl-D-alanine-endopeptidase (penicillin-binding protein 4) [Granulicella rosea]
MSSRVKATGCLALLFCTALLPAQQPVQSTPLGRKIAALVGAPDVVRDHWGVAVYGLDGRLLYGLNEGQLFQPASNAKLFTTAAALAVLGENASFQTDIIGRGVWSANALKGDVILRGGGEPNLSGRALPYAGGEDPGGAPPLRYLEQMADTVAATGLKTIAGDIVGDDTFFPWEPYPRDWASDDLVWGYGAPVSALTVNDNQIKATVSPSQQGAPALIALDPAVPYYTVVNTVMTGPPKSGTSVQFERQVGSKVLRVFGTIAAGDAADVEEIAIQDPAEYAAIAFKAMLEARGIAVQGTARAEHRLSQDAQAFAAETHVDAPGLRSLGPNEGVGRARSLTFTSCDHCDPKTMPVEKILATHRSHPLNDDIVMTNKVSQNLHVELLLHHLGMQYGEDGSTAQGVRVVRAFLLRAGLDPQDFVFFDGSGMSGHDLVTPRAAAKILLYATKQPWGELYRSSLPIAGVDGTLEGRFAKSPLKGKLHAKTGTTGESRALSGYVECASGRTVVFSIMVGNHPPSTSFDRTVMDKIVEAIAAGN